MGFPLLEFYFPLNSQPHSVTPSQRASLAQQLHTISHTIFRLTRRGCTCVSGTLPQSSKYTPRFSKCLVVNSGVVCALTLMRWKLQLWFKIHGPQRSLGSAAYRAPCPGSKISCDHWKRWLKSLKQISTLMLWYMIFLNLEFSLLLCGGSISKKQLSIQDVNIIIILYHPKGILMGKY